MLLGVLAASQRAHIAADTASVPSLVISQLKITSSNGQFVTLYNQSQKTLDMSKYQLEYFNSYDLAKATSSKLVPLTGMVSPHGYFMVNDSALLLCYQLTVDSVSLGFSSTAGLVEVLAFNQAGPGNSVTPTLQDYVGWSKAGASGAQTLPANNEASLLRQPIDAQNNPAVSVPGAGSWQAVQPDATNACNLTSLGAGSSQIVPTGLSQLLLAPEPPATIVSLANDTAVVGTAAASLPTTDIGLMAPKLTEILPNPVGAGNDAKDEFIELYNPNPVAFDLSGFGLQAGLTTLHNFSFAVETSLPPQSFTAFYASVTGLSLSNTTSQVKLLDPFGNSISSTDRYSNAKDGQAWALANGTWFWTTTGTPGAANIINQPVSKKLAKALASKTKSSPAKGKIKAATTKKTKLATKKNSSAAVASTTPIRSWVLALAAGLALLYGAYEYRADLANHLYQFRRYLSNRRTDRT